MTCKCDDLLGHARAVESAVWQSLMNAQSDPEKEEYWFTKACFYEKKFLTDHGVWYGDVIRPKLNGT